MRHWRIKEESLRLTMPNSLVREHERLDELHRNGYFIIQDPKRFCFGMDAVLLSGFAKAKEGERVLDLGTGTGIIPILMAAKTAAKAFTALEIQEESADMARRSVQYNHLEDRIEIVTGDIKDASARFGASSFDMITTNPPYMIGSMGLSLPPVPGMRYFVHWMMCCAIVPSSCAPEEDFIWYIVRFAWQRFSARWQSAK